MTKHADDRRLMRLLAAILTGLWAVTAVVIATAYRPGGPVDIAVALACFVPVVIADAGAIWPPRKLSRTHRLALIWVWIAAVLFTIPVLYGIAATLASDGPQGLVPSFEAAYGGAIALFATSFFSVVGLVHLRRRARPLERHASLMAAGLAGVLTIVAGLSFVFVAVVNDRDLRAEEPATSRFGPTDPILDPPFCDEPVALGRNAHVVISAKSSLDNRDRGTAVLEGQRGGKDEAWGGSWTGPDGAGQEAYLRVGLLAWLNEHSDEPGAPGTDWRRVQPNPFELLGGAALTMDGPPHAVADTPRGTIVAEDLGVEHIEGARARHCRTFITGSTALSTFVPLRWLLYDSSDDPGDSIPRWRGEMDWWVFADGELGLAAVEVSGSRAETPWQAEGVRVVLEAELSATDRDRHVDVAAPGAAAAAGDADGAGAGDVDGTDDADGAADTDGAGGTDGAVQSDDT